MATQSHLVRTTSEHYARMNGGSSPNASVSPRKVIITGSGSSQSQHSWGNASPSGGQVHMETIFHMYSHMNTGATEPRPYSP